MGTTVERREDVFFAAGLGSGGVALVNRRGALGLWEGDEQRCVRPAAIGIHHLERHRRRAKSINPCGDGLGLHPESKLTVIVLAPRKDFAVIAQSQRVTTT
jgi:hypothetical protein